MLHSGYGERSIPSARGFSCNQTNICPATVGACAVPALLQGGLEISRRLLLLRFSAISEKSGLIFFFFFSI